MKGHAALSETEAVPDIHKWINQLSTYRPLWDLDFITTVAPYAYS